LIDQFGTLILLVLVKDGEFFGKTSAIPVFWELKIGLGFFLSEKLCNSGLMRILIHKEVFSECVLEPLILMISEDLVILTRNILSG
jgi:hypothetical protein